VDFSRLKRGELVAGAAGLVLFGSLFLSWFAVKGNENLCGAGKDSCSGFETFGILDPLLVAGAAAPWILIWIIVRGHALSWPPGEVTAIVGLTAAVLILYNGVVDQAGENQTFVSLDPGWYVGLLRALGIAVGGAISQMQRGGAIRRPPGSF
jgi:hypothetical protein